ncbi:MAG: chorismate synthase [Ignavibacteria bacterium]|nr:chorismate synthase [Ignavibacteria bacterium]
MRFLTAGESHGKGLTIIIEGLPAGIPITEDYINAHLARRQKGYGRGMRMKIETDKAELLSGVRFGKTTGQPVSMIIWNKDWENWTDKLAVNEENSQVEKISIPRPGHADLVGTVKYGYDDIRNSIERSSARETAARVAAGSFARAFLEQFGITVGSYVESIGNCYPEYDFYRLQLLEGQKGDFTELNTLADDSEVRVIEKEQENRIIELIKKAKKDGDTLGGTFIVFASGLPVGLGSFSHYDRRLDARLAHAIMSIHAVKAVEVGSGFDVADTVGSKVHDEIILKDGNISRKSNHAGGIEGGISTGMPVLLRAAMKPIATLMSPIGSLDLVTMEKVEARRERSDFTAVPACAVIAESMAAWVVAEAFLEKFGGDSLTETQRNYEGFTTGMLDSLSAKFTREV